GSSLVPPKEKDYAPRRAHHPQPASLQTLRTASLCGDSPTKPAFLAALCPARLRCRRRRRRHLVSPRGGLREAAPSPQERTRERPARSLLSPVLVAASRAARRACGRGETPASNQPSAPHPRYSPGEEMGGCTQVRICAHRKRPRFAQCARPCFAWS
ncbi:hypothetical protein E2320_011803, partial [Naja naja]